MNPRYTKLYTEPFEGGDVTYYLTESEIAAEEGTFTRFGAMVEKSDGERAEVLDIFGDRRRAERLISKLRRNLVTPATLLDVVSDELYADEFAAT